MQTDHYSEKSRGGSGHVGTQTLTLLCAGERAKTNTRVHLLLAVWALLFVNTGVVVWTGPALETVPLHLKAEYVLTAEKEAAPRSLLFVLDINNGLVLLSFLDRRSI